MRKISLGIISIFLNILLIAGIVAGYTLHRDSRKLEQTTIHSTLGGVVHWGVDDLDALDFASAKLTKQARKEFNSASIYVLLIAKSPGYDTYIFADRKTDEIARFVIKKQEAAIAEGQRSVEGSIRTDR